MGFVARLGAITAACLLLASCTGASRSTTARGARSKDSAEGKLEQARSLVAKAEKEQSHARAYEHHAAAAELVESIMSEHPDSAAAEGLESGEERIGGWSHKVYLEEIVPKKQALAEADGDLLAALALVVREAGFPKWRQNQVLARVALAYVHQGEPDKARALVSTSPEDLANPMALTAVEKVLIAAGDLGAAKKVVKSPTMNKVESLIEEGKLDAALELAREIEPDEARTKALEAVAVGCATKGENEMVLAALGDIESVLDRWDALKAAVRAYGRVGQLDRASEAMEGSGIHGEYEPVLVTAGVAAADAGHLDEALELARGMQDEWCKAAVMLVVGENLAKAGDRDRCMEVLLEAHGPALSCSDKHERCEYVLVDIAEILAEIGELDQAWKVAREIEDPEVRSSSIFDIAWLHLEAGKLAKAEQAAKPMKDPEPKMNLLGAIARKHAENGDVENALRLAAQLVKLSKAGGCWEMVDSICPVVEGLVAAKMTEKAKGLGKSIQDEECLERFHICLGQAHARAGDHDKAMKTVESLMSYEEEELLEEMTGIYAAVGDLERAREMMELLLKNPWGGWSSYDESGAIHLGKALVRAGQVDEAVELANRFKIDWFRSSILMHISSECLKQGKLESALTTMKEARALRANTLVLMDLIEEPLESGSFEKALFFIHFIDKSDISAYSKITHKEEAVGKFLGTYLQELEKSGAPPGIEEPEILGLVLSLLE
jgi:tetratricopeptide (TPR) repeat protein